MIGLIYVHSSFCLNFAITVLCFICVVYIFLLFSESDKNKNKNVFIKLYQEYQNTEHLGYIVFECLILEQTILIYVPISHE